MDEETLFELIVSASESERDVLLDQHCEGNPQLRSRIENLLRAYSAGKSAAIDPTELQDILADDSKPDPTRATEETPQSDVGTVLEGKYTLREQIGEGGMGAVWLATQSSPVKRKVAVKLIKAGMDSRQVVARFEAERQALAMMDHPNIAKVFDGGMTEQGRPYFVMEYVKGIPLTDYCDQARLSVKQRLELYVPVCQAIQHAHQKGIVHRDLKPSNILVCLYDGKPVCKVIDFGLAKALHQPLTEHSVYTSHGAMVGTPLYMSPEQAEYNNLDVDTRTDLYSLGVVLYELLTGTTPLEREQLRKAAYDEVLRLIKEVEPPRPSMRLSQSDSLRSIAAQRNIEPRHLGRSLSGDLDWIVMKSLEKERSRRYETAAGLARDVERYLNEEAIEARPPNSTYRLGKFLRKHKLQATAFVAVMLAMILGTTAAGWGWVQARQAAVVAKDAERSVRESLESVTAERDAKNAALAAEAEQRKVAEELLVDGILRPKTLSDWADLPGDRLKLRALEVALQSPKIATRLIGQREQVMHACVGLSLNRREEALRLLASARDRQLQDYRIRLSAIVLTLELGKLDSEVFETIKELLFDEKLRDDHSEELANTMVTRSHLFNDDMARTIIKESANRCIQSGAHFGGSSNLLREFDRGATNLNLRLKLLDRAAQSPGKLSGKHLGFALRGMSEWQHLTDEERDRRWEPLLEYQKQFGPYEWDNYARQGLVALVLSATDAQLRELWKVATDQYAQMQVDGVWDLEELELIASRVSQDQISESLEALLDSSRTYILRDDYSYSKYVLDESDFIDVLVGRLGDRARSKFVQYAQSLDAIEGESIARKLVLYSALLPDEDDRTKRKVLDELLAFSEVPREEEYLYANWLSTLGKCVSAANPDQAQVSWDAVTHESVLHSEEWYAIGEIQSDNMRAVASQMTEQQLEQVIEQLDQNLSAEIRSPKERQWAVLSFLSVVDRLTDSQFGRFWDRNSESLLNDLLLTEFDLEWGHARRVLNLVMSRLTRSQLDLVYQSLQKRLLTQTFEDQRETTVEAFTQISKLLSSAQINELSSFMSALIGEDISPQLRTACYRFLLPVVDRLPASRIEQLMKRDVPGPLSNEEISLHLALASKCPKGQHDARTYSLIRRSQLDGDRYVAAEQLPELMHDPKQIVRWLMTSNCVGNVRAGLLMRFEELVLHDGKPIFREAKERSSEEAQKDGSEPATTGREFLTVYDAAEWIDANWPEFDLEEHPVKATESSDSGEGRIRQTS